MNRSGGRETTAHLADGTVLVPAYDLGWEKDKIVDAVRAPSEGERRDVTAPT